MTQGDSNTRSRELPLAEVARLLRRSRGYLAGCISAGMPARSERGPRGVLEWRVDPGHAAKWLEAEAVRKTLARERERHEAEVAKLRAALEVAGAESDEPATWQEARRRRTLADARLRELELAERRGDLASVDALTRFTVAVFTSVRERFLYLAGKLAPELAVATKPATCAALVDAEVRVILTAIADSAAEAVVANAAEETQRRAGGRR